MQLHATTQTPKSTGGRMQGGWGVSRSGAPWGRPHLHTAWCSARAVCRWRRAPSTARCTRADSRLTSAHAWRRPDTSSCMPRVASASPAPTLTCACGRHHQGSRQLHNLTQHPMTSQCLMVILQVLRSLPSALTHVNMSAALTQQLHLGAGPSPSWLRNRWSATACAASAGSDGPPARQATIHAVELHEIKPCACI